MSIDIYDVLDAASTKWVLILPGLWGHCIGDPYYLTSEQGSYYPDLGKMMKYIKWVVNH